ncbi:hypothetical protein [Mesorhizobium sp.]|uniref:maleate cis-trans isomerase family protein n=1 Tax=Mesorhizobium sp. TaxID=1871066 RepID=UPI000FD30F04|nr:hypothetical protein [Mesorhizobium sp.]RUV79056.1 Asp/Glu/hydantoin racemase [Mesorhizobium sp. M5C.F.Ca.IN.020.14.1.1]RWI36150.1 MAG: Asp/Glu/hydantoin racemase [Mesorhizobium sp.]RWI63581.1 MAG: Asp/Glu/hydantoin racemase [Mesorhizobium sp.]RWJ22844.1 MAG: Asp/Glu/hydantoin racemase [Mesorhizobium sp.]TIQ70088.1 MAG: Asp/Glu/hydantoin racemase [Mesorhizobium sp.]
MLAEKDKATPKVWSKIKYETDGGIGTRAHIGMAVYDCDQTLSHEARAMLGLPGVALYETRLISSRRDQPLSVDLLQASFREMDDAILRINTRRPSDVIALGCTSAAMVVGQPELERRVRTVYPQTKVTDPFTGIVTALGALSATRVGYISPYPRDVAERMVSAIEAEGYPIYAVVEFHDDQKFVRDDAPFIDAGSIAAAVDQVISSSDVDTIVISCTQMRAVDIINKLEQRTGKNIITSNQAMCWHALRLAGCDDVAGGFGRLFTTQLV